MSGDLREVWESQRPFNGCQVLTGPYRPALAYAGFNIPLKPASALPSR